jgi:hypothetical protein
MLNKMKPLNTNVPRKAMVLVNRRSRQRDRPAVAVLFVAAWLVTTCVTIRVQGSHSSHTVQYCNAMRKRYYSCKKPMEVCMCMCTSDRTAGAWLSEKKDYH